MIKLDYIGNKKFNEDPTISDFLTDSKSSLQSFQKANNAENSSKCYNYQINLVIKPNLEKQSKTIINETNKARFSEKFQQMYN